MTSCNTYSIRSKIFTASSLVNHYLNKHFIFFLKQGSVKSRSLSSIRSLSTKNLFDRIFIPILKLFDLKILNLVCRLVITIWLARSRQSLQWGTHRCKFLSEKPSRTNFFKTFWKMTFLHMSRSRSFFINKMLQRKKYYCPS